MAKTSNKTSTTITHRNGRLTRREKIRRLYDRYLTRTTVYEKYSEAAMMRRLKLTRTATRRHMKFYAENLNIPNVRIGKSYYFGLNR
jgi:hypothetical protein